MITRRSFGAVLAAVPGAAIGAYSQDSQDSSRGGESLVFFGCNNARRSKGIHASRLDLATGKLSTPELVAECATSSFCHSASCNAVYLADLRGAVRPHCGDTSGLSWEAF